MGIIVRVGALVKARVDYWVGRFLFGLGGVLFGFWFVCLVFFPQVSGKITTDFYNSRPIQKNCIQGTCMYSFFFQHINALVAEINLV